MKREILQDAIEEAELGLDDAKSYPFSLRASSRLKKRIKDYARQLASEAIRLSKRHQTDMVSATDVERASDYLGSNLNRGLFKHSGTVGGLLLGISFTNAQAMIALGHLSVTRLLVTIICGTVGAFFIAKE